MKRMIIAAALFAASTFAAAAGNYPPILAVGQRITLHSGQLNYFGCRNIDNTKEAYRRWFDRNGSEFGRISINLFVHEHDIWMSESKYRSADEMIALAREHLTDECQVFDMKDDIRTVVKVEDWHKGTDGYNGGQIVCLAPLDLDPSPPDQHPADYKYVPSPCFWTIFFMPPTILSSKQN